MMERNDVIKALECCAAPVTRCDECPVDKAKKDDCVCGVYLAGEALKVIKLERVRRTRYQVFPDGRLKMIPTIESVKADTVKKMAERLYPLYKVLCVDEGDWRHEVDQIAKEMLD